jgi:hypothetical protein
MFRKKVRFYGEGLLSPRPNPKLEDKVFLAFRDFLFNIFKPTIHIRGYSHIPNLMKCYAVLTKTHSSLHRWEDNIKTDLQEIGCGSVNWIELAQDMDRLLALVNKVKRGIS